MCRLLSDFELIYNNYKWNWLLQYTIGYTTNLSFKKSTTCLKSSAQYSLFMSASTLSDALWTGTCRKLYTWGWFSIFAISWGQKKDIDNLFQKRQRAPGMNRHFLPFYSFHEDRVLVKSFPETDLIFNQNLEQGKWLECVIIKPSLEWQLMVSALFLSDTDTLLKFGKQGLFSSLVPTVCSGLNDCTIVYGRHNASIKLTKSFI